jgi:hypothetical protein
MAGRGPRSAIERAEIGNSRSTVVRACALLDRMAQSLHYAVSMTKQCGSSCSLLRGGAAFSIESGPLNTPHGQGTIPQRLSPSQ